MLNFQDLLAFLLAFIILCFSFILIKKISHGDFFKKRIKDLIQYKEELRHEEAGKSKIYHSAEKHPSGLQKIVSKFQDSGKEAQGDLKKLFIKAGLRSNNALFLYGLCKIVAIFTFSILTTVVVVFFAHWEVLYKILVVIAAALAGSYMVDFILQKLVKFRQTRIRKAFPEALDLMIICTEAGLSLTATVQRVAREIAPVSPDLGYELALLSIELNMLSDRQKALQNFSDRLDSAHFKSIISNIQQAEQYGTPIAQTMRAIAEQFRQDRLVEAETRAAKLPVLMSIPMMVFIFPCIYIVILGPAILNVTAMFGWR